MEKFSGSVISYLVIFFLLIISGLQVIPHTPFGAAMSMDSLSYLSVAQQIVLGHGLSLPDYSLDGGGHYPLTLWPPLYPLVLSATIPHDQVFGVNAGHFIAWINVTSLWVLLILFFTFAKNVWNYKIAVGAALLLAFLPSMQVTYLYAWSETLFIPIVFSAFLVFICSLKSDKPKLLPVIFSAFLLVIAFYLRYAALGFVAALVCNIALLHAAPYRDRLRLAGTVIGLFGILISPLLIRNYLLTGLPIGNRSASTAILGADLKVLILLLREEFFSSSVVLWSLAILGILILLVLTVRQKNKAAFEDSSTIAFYTFIWALIYLLFLLINRLVSHMDLDTRMIAPIVPLVFISFIGLFYSASRIVKPTPIIVILVVCIVPLVGKVYGIYRDVIFSWNAAGSPGQIVGIQYNSTTSHEFAAYKKLGDIVRVPKESVILTDLDRPQIAHYFFPANIVRQLPSEAKSVDIARLLNDRYRDGLVIITNNSTLNTFTELVSEESFLQIQDEKGGVYDQFMLLKLPLNLKDRP